MTAEILTFPVGVSGTAHKVPRRSCVQTWLDQHLPLIEATMDLHGADDRELQRRCNLIAETEGAPVLKQLVAQLDRLAAHIAGIVSALSMTSRRIRRTIAAEGQGA